MTMRRASIATAYTATQELEKNGSVAINVSIGRTRNVLASIGSLHPSFATFVHNFAIYEFNVFVFEYF